MSTCWTARSAWTRRRGQVECRPCRPAMCRRGGFQLRHSALRGQGGGPLTVAGDYARAGVDTFAPVRIRPRGSLLAPRGGSPGSGSRRGFREYCCTACQRPSPQAASRDLDRKFRPRTFGRSCTAPPQKDAAVRAEPLRRGRLLAAGACKRRAAFRRCPRIKRHEGAPSQRVPRRGASGPARGRCPRAKAAMAGRQSFPAPYQKTLY